jgi:hypothetical protein
LVLQQGHTPTGFPHVDRLAHLSTVLRHVRSSRNATISSLATFFAQRRYALRLMALAQSQFASIAARVFATAAKSSGLSQTAQAHAGSVSTPTVRATAYAGALRRTFRSFMAPPFASSLPANHGRERSAP